MPGGRPAKRQERYEVFEPLAEWFARALENAGFRSVNAFLEANRLLNKNLVYDLAKAARPLKLEEIRTIAATLGQPAAEAETLWRTARRAAERQVRADQDAASAISSWDDIPGQPHPQLKDLLEAQSETVEQLPYQRLQVTPPPLSTIYVRQQVTAHEDADAPEPKRGTPETATALDALNLHEHLLITGEPGSGKSTFGYFVTGLLARRWLGAEEDCPVTEPLIPLRVPARELVRPGSWTTALAGAVNDTLGPILVTSVTAELLARRVHGARWLLFVDGLDEITDDEARRKLVSTLAHHARGGGDFRLVVSTRALPSDELAPLMTERIGHYRMVEFKSADLADFAERWFPDERAGQYLHQVRTSRLRELVRNPLLATITAVMFAKEPTRPLPTSRVELYERFYEYLVDERFSGRSRSDGWPRARRDALIEHLGRARLESERDLAEVAREWAESQGLPSDSTDGVGSVQNVLIGTGLFVHEGPSIRFLHHSFAEYVSARAIAAGLDSATDLEAWLDGDHPENLALFTALIWGKANDGGLDASVRRMLRRDSGDFAGMLLAEGGAAVSPAVAEQVVRYLGDSGLASGRSDFRVLASMCENAVAEAYLRGLIEHEELPVAVRAGAAGALLRIKGPAYGRDPLVRLLDGASPELRLQIAQTLTEVIGETAVPIEIVSGVIAEAGTRNQVRLSAIEALFELGEQAVAEHELAKHLLEDLDVEASLLWLTVSGPDQADRVVEHRRLEFLDPWSLAQVADRLAKVGRHDLVPIPARAVLASPDADGMDIGWAVRAWSKGAGEATRAEVATVVGDLVSRASIGQLNGSYLDELIDCLGESGMTENATELRGRLEAESASRKRDDQPHETNPNVLMKRAEYAGDPDLAVAYARRALATAQLSDSDSANMALLLLGHGVDDAESEVAVGNWDTLDVRKRRIAAEKLAEAGVPLYSALAASVLDDPEVGENDLIAVAGLLLRHQGDGTLPAIVARAATVSAVELFVPWMGLMFHLGRDEEFAALAVRALTHPYLETGLSVEVSSVILKANRRDIVLPHLRAALDDPGLTPRARANVSATLAWLSYLRPGTDSCGVPTCQNAPRNTPGRDEAAPHP
ncbi:hypothetical protein AB0I28_04805 [Phytomonospora sp. NPDC050363]|uniref:NACHT domain-containing protein n=1 Tax=Phytomonospora sp. NPDC050363 TaxID=3155642 RepID=UPI0033F5F32F